MKDLYTDENKNDLASAVQEFLSQGEYTLADLLKIIADVIEYRL